MHTIIQEDLNAIYDSLTIEQKEAFGGSTILITGCCGFIGFYLMHFLSHYKTLLRIKKIIALDNGLLPKRKWLDDVVRLGIEFIPFDIVKEDISTIAHYEQINYVLHLASVASPTFYRRYPLETIDANVFGLRKLLEACHNIDLKGFLFFSTSEVYGDPPAQHIPTPESYKGNVSTTGPRACYDESKRLGETLCYQFYHLFNMPITIVRPFNNYGAGMSLRDKRLPADFAQAVMAQQDIVIFSDGTPTRTFCYISDAVSGYLKALLYQPFDIFNIGMDRPEISVKALAHIYSQCAKDLFGYDITYHLKPHSDSNYLVDNPNRRCPNIDKAQKLLSFNPTVLVDEGVQRFLTFLAQKK